MSTINELKDKLDTKTLNFALLGLVTGSIYNILWMNKATQIIAESTKTKLVDNTYIIWVSVCLGMSYLLSGTGDEIVSILSGILTIASMVLHVVWAFKARAALTSYALNEYRIDRKRPAKAVLTGATGYSAGRATRQGSSSPTRFTGQSAITFSTCRR